jgi:hypothetical protein
MTQQRHSQPSPQLNPTPRRPPKVAADGFEAVPPRVVRFDTFVDHNRSDKIEDTLVTALRKQRPIVGIFNEMQQA